MDSIPSFRRFNSQVPCSCSSLSCPSEPPDVGNWFSSYEYQSPDDLDSNFSLKESAFRGRESQRDEEDKADFEKIGASDEGVVREKPVQCRGTRVKNNNHTEDMCLTKNLDSFSTCSLFSEPPDIRNWFSSYAYESSAPDTSSLFSNEEVPEENKGADERFDLEVIDEDEDRSENVHPKVCVKHNSSSDKNMELKQKQASSRGDGSAEMKKNLTIASTSHLEKILQPCMPDKILLHNLGPTQYEETLSLNHGSPGCNQEAHLTSSDTDTSAMTPPQLVQKLDTKEAKSKAQIQADKLHISASLATSFSARSSTSTRYKENDGFVTTRKNSYTRANDENSVKKPAKTLLECSTNTGTVPLACEKNGVTKRKALTEATNLQRSNATEITGKWKCPQKSKPYTGPALKQLRLERWVHRV